jgi:transcriptional regulator with XRE-family HTH domain
VDYILRASSTGDGGPVELSSPAALGTAVRAARRSRGLSQQALADAAGMSRVSVSRLEHGLSNPTWDTVLRVGAALALRLDASWGGSTPQAERHFPPRSTTPPGPVDLAAVIARARRP